MAKISLTEPLSGYNLAAINANFQAIETEFQDKVLYRNNPVGEANNLETDVDANSKRIYNLPEPTLASEAARLQDVQNAIAGASQANLIGFTPVGTIASTNVQAAVAEVLSDLAAPSGASLVGHIPGGAGATATTVQLMLRGVSTSVTQFGAANDGITDARADIQDAIDYVHGIGGGIVRLPAGDYAILSSHPTKTFTTPGDDGSVYTGYGTNVAAETVYQIPVGIWLKEGVVLEFEENASIIGDWTYATTSAINISQRIGILISSSAGASNPKSAIYSAGIIGSGRIYSFMMNVVAEGILANSNFIFSSNYSAFPFVAQGADRCSFDINTAACKTGVIIGGQWLTRSNSIAATYLPVYPSGFGTPATYSASDVSLIGWCDACTFSCSMSKPVGLSVTVTYGAWEIAIDTFFDTYFFKTASTSRLGTATPSPAITTLYTGVVGFGVMVISRYGRSVGIPKFIDIKTYGNIRGDIYCDAALSPELSNVYSEIAGTIGASAFGVAVTDPYGTVGVASGRFIKVTGTGIVVNNYFAFSSQITTPISQTTSLTTRGCYFNVSSSVYNNFVSALQGSVTNKTITAAASLGGFGFNLAEQVGTKIVTTAVSSNIATIDITSTSSGYAVHGVLEVQVTVRGSAGNAGYASSVYEFPIIISNNNGTLYSLGGTTAMRSTVGTQNAAFANITLAFACTIASTQATLAITPTITGSLAITTAHAYWSLRVDGAKLAVLTAV